MGCNAKIKAPATACSTKKEAAELVTAWNDAYKANGEYLFDSPAF